MAPMSERIVGAMRRHFQHGERPWPVAWRLLALALFASLIGLSGCAAPVHPPVIEEVAASSESAQCLEELPAEDDDAVNEEAQAPPEEEPGPRSAGGARKRDHAGCFLWKPVAKQPPARGKKTSLERGRCQPQSLIYARCRSGIDSCRLGDTSPAQWFSCARKLGNTASLPASGAIMVLDVNARRKMYTGHPVFVEEVGRNGDGTWRLRISHTNYDRQCRLDQDSTVVFDPRGMTATFASGPWASWARDLKVLGFILR